MIRWPIICIVYVSRYSKTNEATRITRNISAIWSRPASSPVRM